MRAQSVMAIAHSLGAQLSERVIYLGHRDRAALDVHQLVNVAPIKADDIVLRVDRDPVPIAVGQGEGTMGRIGGSDNFPMRRIACSTCRAFSSSWCA